MSYCRSPELMSPADTSLLVVDVQQKLIPLISGHQRVIWNIQRLLSGARLLKVHTSATEQYPSGLGGTVSELSGHFQQIPDKVTFSCVGCSKLISQWPATVQKVLLVGIETHVCVMQTAYDLMAAGYRVYLAADAVGSRYPIDYEWGLRRLESSGVTVTTTEAALFEWCQTAEHPAFKELSQLIRQAPPSS